MSGEVEGQTRPGVRTETRTPNSELGLRPPEEAAYSQIAADVWNFQSSPTVCPKGLHPHFDCRNKPFWAFDFISEFLVFTGRTVLSVKYFNISLKSYKDQGVLFFPCNPSSSFKFIAMCLMLRREKIGPGALRFSASSRGALTDTVCVSRDLFASVTAAVWSSTDNLLWSRLRQVHKHHPHGPAFSGPRWGSWQWDGLNRADVLRPECPYAPPNCCPPCTSHLFSCGVFGSHAG